MELKSGDSIFYKKFLWRTTKKNQGGDSRKKNGEDESAFQKSFVNSFYNYIRLLTAVLQAKFLKILRFSFF